jgi:hypothetical protein
VVVESAGVPCVSLVCTGFEQQARSTARGLGYAMLPLAVLRGHVDAQSTQEMLAAFLTHTVDEIIDGLTRAIDVDASADVEPGAWDIAATGTIDELHDEFARRGWSDGSPFIPPTRERVEAFIDAAGFDPFRSLGVARPSGRDLTIWSLAVNAVMAGCRSEQLPVLVAMATVLIDDHYGVEHSGNTTGADALVVLSGPDAALLGFNSGPGALRDGVPANTSVGRWLRLLLRNVFGFTTNEHDKATFGNTFRVVLAEDQATLDDIGWTSLADDLAVDSLVGGGELVVPGAAATSAVSMARINSSIIVGSVVGSTPAEIIPYLADGLVRVTGWDLTHVFGLGRAQYRPLLVLSPLLARTFSRAGWSKHDVRNALFAHARIPAWKFEKLIGEWSNLTAGQRRLIDLATLGEVPPVFATSDDPERLVPIVTNADRFCIAVAGDPNRANAMAFANDGPHGYWTVAPIDHTPSTDLVCNVASVTNVPMSTT